MDIKALYDELKQLNDMIEERQKSLQSEMDVINKLHARSKAVGNLIAELEDSQPKSITEFYLKEAVYMIKPSCVVTPTSIIPVSDLKQVGAAGEKGEKIECISGVGGNLIKFSDDLILPITSKLLKIKEIDL